MPGAQLGAVEVVAGPDAGRRVQTQDDSLRVGTDPANDLVLTDATVSRRHLEVERTARGLLVRDLGSRNGTFLDGRAGAAGLPAARRQGGSWARRSSRCKLDARATEVEVQRARSPSAQLVGASRAACAASSRSCAASRART